MKRLTILILGLMSLTAVSAQTFQLKATLNTHEADGAWMYLRRAGIGDPTKAVVIDSARVDNGTVSFRTPVAGEPFVGILSLPPKAFHEYYSVPDITVIVEDARVTLDYKDYNVTLRGGKMNAAYEKVLAQERHTRAQVMALNAATQDNADDRQTEAVNDSITKLFQALRPHYWRFIRENIKNSVGAYFFLAYAKDYYPETLYNELAKEVAPEYMQNAIDRDKAIGQAQQREDEARKSTQKGLMYHDFTTVTLAGDTVRFSSFLKPGCVTILDFWASWCGPCRQEIPTIKKLYEDYHAKGLNVVSVSLDERRDMWLKAVEKEQMPWPQCGTMEAYRSEAAQAYGVQAIPFLVLIDQQGRMALVNMHGDVLKQKIEELLK